MRLESGLAGSNGAKIVVFVAVSVQWCRISRPFWPGCGRAARLDREPCLFGWDPNSWTQIPGGTQIPGARSRVLPIRVGPSWGSCVRPRHRLGTASAAASDLDLSWKTRRQPRLTQISHGKRIGSRVRLRSRLENASTAVSDSDLVQVTYPV